MTEAVFWVLIGMLDWNATGDDEAVVAPVVMELSERGVDEIRAFDDILSAKLFALDTKSHASEIGEESYRDGEYFSADWFLYARCAVVANGRDFFEVVLTEPSQFPKNVEFESLLYIAQRAYERKTGNEYDYEPEISYETYSNKEGWR